MRKPFAYPAVAAGAITFALLFTNIAGATAISMNFDQLNSAGEYVDNYYNGGCGSSYMGNSVTCGGPNNGVAWSGFLAGGIALGDAFHGGADNPPSAPNIVDAFGRTMNVAAGFTGTLAFDYASPQHAGNIAIYSGINGTGTLLGTFAISETAGYCGGDTPYSCWSPFTATFSGTARSTVLDSVFTGEFTLDNVTLDVNSAPEPAALGIFGFGLLLIGTFIDLRRRCNGAVRQAV